MGKARTGTAARRPTQARSGSGSPPQGATRSRSRDAGRRRIVLAAAGLAAVGVAGFLLFGRASGGGSSDARYVGGDLHVVAAYGVGLYVSGHDGASRSLDAGVTWQPIPSLRGKDGMGWAFTSDAVLVGGHGGLYRSTDAGATFAAAPSDLPVTDVHALGAGGGTMYLASPQGGVFASTDGGRTWTQRGREGVSFMGTMLVDPAEADHVLAPDMRAGVAESRDGGRSWHSLGGPPGAMSISWAAGDSRHLVAVGMQGAGSSRDGGASWQPLKVPTGTSVLSFDASGRALIAGVLEGDSAQLYRSGDDGGTWSKL